MSCYERGEIVFERLERPPKPVLKSCGTAAVGFLIAGPCIDRRRAPRRVARRL